MNKILFHTLFWIFIFLYVFDYIIDLYGVAESIVYTTFEVAVYISEFYTNLLILIPLVLIKRGKIAYFISVLVLLSIGFASYYITGINKILSPENFHRAIISFLLNHSLFISISYIVWFFDKYFTEKQLRLQLENEKLQAELQLLKTQISPHFLFNTLNNIYALTLVKSDNAPKMLSALADILRYFLYEGEKKTTFLQSEIEVINKYIEIQRHRQIAGLENIKINVPQDLSNLQVPPLLLITLVENAFKHGDIIENKNGFVLIDIATMNNKLYFSIANSYVPKETSAGIGLRNLQSQLKNIFGNHYELTIDTINSIYKVNLSFDGK